MSQPVPPAGPGAPRRRLLTALALAGVALSLAGCATLAGREVTASVSAWGEWPQGRSPGSYAFERLPSQASRPEVQQRLEEAAGRALAGAGFRPVAAGAEPEVLVQLGARVSRSDTSPWDDPLWWHGGFGLWRHTPWRGAHWSPTLMAPTPRYDREVALLIRERASGKPLYEARASSEGYQSMPEGMLMALYAAALKDFPASGLNPRSVTVPIER